MYKGYFPQPGPGEWGQNNETKDSFDCFRQSEK
jgi:hypothetical protein